MFLWFKRITNITVFTFATLRSRTIISNSYLIFYLSAFWVSSAFIYRYFFHFFAPCTFYLLYHKMRNLSTPRYEKRSRYAKQLFMEQDNTVCIAERYEKHRSAAFQLRRYGYHRKIRRNRCACGCRYERRDSRYVCQPVIRHLGCSHQSYRK